jgi:hypothetical protein
VVLLRRHRAFSVPAKLSPSIASLTVDAEPFSLPRDQTESLSSPSLKHDGQWGSFLPLWNAPAGKFCLPPSLSLVHLFVLILESLGFFGIVLLIFDWMSDCTFLFCLDCFVDWMSDCTLLIVFLFLSKLSDFVLLEWVPVQDSKLILFRLKLGDFIPACCCSFSLFEPVFLVVFIWKKEGIGVLVAILVRSYSGLISVFYKLLFLLTCVFVSILGVCKIYGVVGRFCCLTV